MYQYFWKLRPIPHFICLILLPGFFSCTNNTSENQPITALAPLPDSIAEGKKMFESTCVRCHGMDGSGLTGPSLKRQKLKYAPDLASFTKVVSFGIAGTGMPSNWVYTEADCRSLYTYINYLRNQGKEVPKGDSASGSLVYKNAGCASCHVMHGEGNSIGPELTEIGTVRNAAYLHQSIIDPAATLPESTDLENGYGFSLYLPVVITKTDGSTLRGLRINEDTYSIQVKDSLNEYYSFNKDELLSIEKLYGQSLMPSYQNKLTKQELENLVAFLYKSQNQ